MRGEWIDMQKWIYDKMIAEYKKESKEELAQNIIALKEIELSDRNFANQCEAGATICIINELFDALEKEGEKSVYLSRLIEQAKNNWNYIVNELSKMNDQSRCSSALDSLKTRVADTKSDYDNI